MTQSGSDPVIRPATPQDEADWRRLWAGYLKFYRAAVPEAATAATWARLLDEGSDMACLVAEHEGRVVGICNYLFHASTWSTQPIAYLQDLYVDRDARGAGAARALILACEDAARKAGAFRLYWQTQEYNGAARSLYDTIVPRSSFIVYRMPL
ncbi:GNAT family N-acetyltransferase [Pararhodobacter sp. SW119]|uniref:GNAT family N-acetyltransferase n=1 Tax=Pararhodobacter sp. SW119 TaxID=2780075 RepID=UPI001AE078E2|nr:GNAT family N-acetyltransferase [Pararhodobacter sp. SW119]